MRATRHEKIRGPGRAGPRGRMEHGMGIHSGHRERMKRRFLEHGADNFDDHQLLELFLFYCKPQVDTNPLAHQLLNTFGSLAGVFDAAYQDLLAVPGVGEHVATAIRLMPQLMRRYEISRATPRDVVHNPDDLGKLLCPYFFGAQNETIYMLSLDAKGQVLSCDLLGQGMLHSVSLSCRKVVEVALANRAYAVILAHNHTSGIAIPSDEDVVSTQMLYDLLQSLDIRLLDHLVIADGDYTSMCSSNLIKGRWAK